MATSEAPPQLDEDDGDWAKTMATAIFELILRREPDREALEAFSGALDSNALRPFVMCRQLMDSDEFGVRASRHPPVARHLVDAMFGALLGRSPDSEAMDAYSGALQDGLSVQAFAEELMRSPEFGARRISSGDGSSAALVGSGDTEAAERLTDAVFGAVLRRPPDPSARAAYAAALRSGVGVKAFIEELIRSPEFATLQPGPRAPQIVEGAEASPKPEVARVSVEEALALIARRTLRSPEAGV